LGVFVVCAACYRRPNDAGNASDAGDMPTSLSIRNLDATLIDRLKCRAARHGRSAEAEVREILRQALEAEAEPGFDALAAELRTLTAGRRHPPAEALMREGRDER
jgi:plasmid stability protein